jgi:hypothetical protein
MFFKKIMSHVSKMQNKCYASKHLVNVLDFKNNAK